MIPALDLLARLRDVHPPPDPSWWPPAPGWWLALALACAMTVLAIRRLPPQWRRWRMRRRLLAVLEQIAARHRAGAPDTTIAAEVSTLLRVAAMQKFPDRDVAGLHGRQWIAFLDSCDRAPGRFEAVGSALTVAPYNPVAAGVDVSPLIRATRHWLRAVV